MTQCYLIQAPIDAILTKDAETGSADHEKFVPLTDVLRNAGAVSGKSLRRYLTEFLLRYLWTPYLDNLWVRAIDQHDEKEEVSQE